MKSEENYYFSNSYGHVVEVINYNTRSPIVLICEHAANTVPTQLKNLGLSDIDLERHISWDPGAREVAIELSHSLNATLIAGCVSRLVYDCNRPPDSQSAIPQKSELHAIPGNQNLSEDQRESRISNVYLPFEETVSKVISHKKNMDLLPVLVTIHSFTPVYFGKKREVELGILHDSDSRLADQMIATACHQTELNVRRNQPYGPQDGVTHTLITHGVKADIHNVMIEIRNDLLNDITNIKKISSTINSILSVSVKNLGIVVDV